MAPAGTVLERTDYLVSKVGGLSHVVAESTSQGLGTRYVRAGDRLLGLFRGTTTRDIHGDHLGSVRLLTDGAGAVTDRYSYSAFGLGTQTVCRRTGVRADGCSSGWTMSDERPVARRQSDPNTLQP